MSAGTNPSGIIDARVFELMREIGIDISDIKPRALIMEMVDQADKVVTMGCGVEGVCLTSLVET